MVLKQGNRGAGGGADTSTHPFSKEGVGIVVGGTTGCEVEVLLMVNIEFGRVGSKKPPA